MSVIASDIKFYLTGGSANADPNASLGGIGSSVEVGSTLHDLFDAVSPAEGSAGDIEYRAIDIKNVNGADTLVGAVVYISTITPSTDSIIALAYDATGTQSIANESTAPTGVTFSSPTTQATGITLGDIGPGATKRLWLRRTITAGAIKVSADAGAITVDGGTV